MPRARLRCCAGHDRSRGLSLPARRAGTRAEAQTTSTRPASTKGRPVKQQFAGAQPRRNYPNTPQILITREFAAPRDLLYRAYTDPELLVQWLGPRSLTMTIDRLEVRDGGTWRFIHRDADGTEYGFHGVHHGTPSPDGIVRTFEFEGFPGHISLETLTLEECGRTTVAHTNVVFQSVEARDGHLQSGMEDGFNESMERLDELLARLGSRNPSTSDSAKG